MEILSLWVVWRTVTPKKQVRLYDWEGKGHADDAVMYMSSIANINNQSIYTGLMLLDPAGR